MSLTEKYLTWSKQELIARLLSYENQKSKDEPVTEQSEVPLSRKRPRKKEPRPFDWSKYSQRRVALKVAYLGWNYHGFAAQNDEISMPTVEGQILNALMVAKLILDPTKCNFTRCGRTDKGVSGLGQVIALDVRSNLSETSGEELKKDQMEIPYVETLNNLLPNDIRIIAWAPVPPDFNARFDCQSREYKYFFAKGNLDINLMREAANKFIGLHDFRNFCKVDPAKQITNFERTMLKAEIHPVKQLQRGDQGEPGHLNVINDGASPFDFYEFTLQGTAFLWHQVRCMMAILFLVGQKLEAPVIIDELLDVTKSPAKPVYDMTSEIPLVLYNCEFNKCIHWHHGRDDGSYLKRLSKQIHEQWYIQMTKSLILTNFLKNIEDINLKELPHPYQESNNVNKFLKEFAASNNQGEGESTEHKSTRIVLGGGKEIQVRKYIPISAREMCDEPEKKNAKYKAKKRIKIDD